MRHIVLNEMDVSIGTPTTEVGAYYGSCTDKYGINWMVNFASK